MAVCGWVLRWSLEAPFPLRIGDGGSLWVGVTVELGSSVSFKDRRWWQFVDGCHGVDEDRRWWKLEIRPWEIQRLDRGCGLEMGIERATNLKKW